MKRKRKPSVAATVTASLTAVKEFQANPAALAAARAAQRADAAQYQPLLKDLHSLYGKHSGDPWWLFALIFESAVVAEEAGHADLARVLGAISTAVRNDDLAMLSDAARPNGNGTMLGAANAYAPETGPGRTNQELARELAFNFVHDEPAFGVLGGEMPFVRLCALLETTYHPAMRNAFGPPQPGWREKIVEAVKDVRERDYGDASRVRRGAIHYARAVVRGWAGISAAEARKLTSELENVEAFL